MATPTKAAGSTKKKEPGEHLDLNALATEQVPAPAAPPKTLTGSTKPKTGSVKAGSTKTGSVKAATTAPIPPVAPPPAPVSALTPVAEEDDDVEIPNEYMPPDEDTAEEDEFEDEDSVEQDEAVLAAETEETEDEDGDEDEDEDEEGDEEEVTDPADAMALARSFLAQRSSVVTGLRQEAANKRAEAHKIMMEAQEKAEKLNKEAVQAEALAQSMSGTTMAGAPTLVSSGATTPVKRRRRRQGVPNLQSINDSAGPVAAPPASRFAPTPEPGTSKAAQTRAINHGKSVNKGILWVLETNSCVSPQKTMALKEISEQIVKKPESGGYGYITNSSQFGNIVRSQLDKLELQKQIVFNDATGGYYLVVPQKSA
jgi:hypothetical protein